MRVTNQYLSKQIFFSDCTIEAFVNDLLILHILMTTKKVITRLPLALTPQKNLHRTLVAGVYSATVWSIYGISKM